jgi:hypothetical protein
MKLGIFTLLPSRRLDRMRDQQALGCTYRAVLKTIDISAVLENSPALISPTAALAMG